MIYCLYIKPTVTSVIKMAANLTTSWRHRFASGSRCISSGKQSLSKCWDFIFRLFISMAGFFYNLKSSLHFVCFIYREITMSDSTIQINTLEELVACIPKDRQSMIHCAVQRMGDTYKHHFILLGHTWSRYHEVCFIIHYTLVQGKRCIAKVMMHKIEGHQL